MPASPMRLCRAIQRPDTGDYSGSGSFQRAWVRRCHESDDDDDGVDVGVDVVSVLRLYIRVSAQTMVPKTIW